MTRACTQAEYFDHQRGQWNAEPRPTDPSAEAIEIAVLVKNEHCGVTQAARLIESFARAEAAKSRLDMVAGGPRP
jgi:hypothetical protein